MAQLTPPRKPITFEYTPRFFAHSLSARSTVLKCAMLGTRRSIMSVTRQPFSDLTLWSSMLRSTDSWVMSKSSGTVGVAKRAYSRSMSTPANIILMTGTFASGTG